MVSPCWRMGRPTRHEASLEEKHFLRRVRVSWLCAFKRLSPTPSTISETLEISRHSAATSGAAARGCLTNASMVCGRGFARSDERGLRSGEQSRPDSVVPSSPRCQCLQSTGWLPTAQRDGNPFSVRSHLSFTHSLAVAISSTVSEGSNLGKTLCLAFGFLGSMPLRPRWGIAAPYECGIVCCLGVREPVPRRTGIC